MQREQQRLERERELEEERLCLEEYDLWMKELHEKQKLQSKEDEMVEVYELCPKPDSLEDVENEEEEEVLTEQEARWRKLDTIPSGLQELREGGAKSVK